MRIVRNVFRRKLRVLLTIFGITIGVLALVVMGSMAEKIDQLVSGGTKYYAGKVTVTAEGAGMMGGGPLSYSKRDAIMAVPGVVEVSGQIGALLDPDTGMTVGMPALLFGSDLLDQPHEEFKADYAQGRPLERGETGVINVGADLVDKLDAKMGGYVTIRDRQFEVVGILDRTLTAPDTSVGMSLADAQEILVSDLPEMIRAHVDTADLVTQFVVYPTPSTDPEELAALINDTVPGVQAAGPSFFEDQIASATKVLNAILYGVAIIALFVGGLSVINTMTMSVSERTREIGVRKAIGASDGQIVRQFLTEAGLIGLIGGVSGLFLGWIAATVANALLKSSNLDLFLVTPRLAIGAVAFAVVLGLVSGLYPSLHAARLQPVTALRYE